MLYICVNPCQITANSVIDIIAKSLLTITTFSSVLLLTDPLNNPEPILRGAVGSLNNYDDEDDHDDDDDGNDHNDDNDDHLLNEWLQAGRVSPPFDQWREQVQLGSTVNPLHDDDHDDDEDDDDDDDDINWHLTLTF